MTLQDNSSQDDVNAGRQVLLSELEVDERRALLVDHFFRHHAEDDVEDDLDRQIRSSIHNDIDQLLKTQWFQELTLRELQELDGLPGWEWHIVLAYEEVTDLLDYEEKGHTSLQEVVKFHLVWVMDSLLDVENEWIADALFRDPEPLANQIAAARGMANAYGINLKDLWDEAR